MDSRKLEVNVPAFDEDRHEYTVGSEKKRHITGVLKAAGLVDDTYYTTAGCIRGQAVHAATEYLEEGVLDWSTLDDEIFGYLKAWERFVARTGWVSIYREKPMYNFDLDFCGKPDRVGWFTDARVNGPLTVLEIKTGAIAEWVKYQTALQVLLLPFHEDVQRVAVQLKKDGTYKLKQFTDPEDIAQAVQFLADTKGA